MKVLILKSFVDLINGRKYRANEGDEIELPQGARWVESGLARPLKTQPETAVKAAPKSRSKKKGSK